MRFERKMWEMDSFSSMEDWQENCNTGEYLHRIDKKDREKSMEWLGEIGGKDIRKLNQPLI